MASPRVAPGLEPYVATGPSRRERGGSRWLLLVALVLAAAAAGGAAWFFLLRDSGSPLAPAYEAAYQANMDVLASMHDAASLAEVAALAAPAGPAAQEAADALAQQPGDSAERQALAAQQALLAQIAALADLPAADPAQWAGIPDELAAALTAATPPEDTLFKESGAFSVRLIDRLVSGAQAEPVPAGPEPTDQE